MRNVDAYILKADGTPVRGVGLYVRDAASGMPIGLNSRTFVDEKGHAVLHLLEGSDYWVHVTQGHPFDETTCGPVRVHVSGDMSALRMTIADPNGSCSTEILADSHPNQ